MLSAQMSHECDRAKWRAAIVSGRRCVEQGWAPIVELGSSAGTLRARALHQLHGGPATDLPVDRDLSLSMVGSSSDNDIAEDSDSSVAQDSEHSEQPLGVVDIPL